MIRDDSVFSNHISPRRNGGVFLSRPSPANAALYTNTGAMPGVLMAPPAPLRVDSCDASSTATVVDVADLQLELESGYITPKDQGIPKLSSPPPLKRIVIPEPCERDFDSVPQTPRAIMMRWPLLAAPAFPPFPMPPSYA